MREESPDDIVGHKTFRGNDPFSSRHEPLTRREAAILVEVCEREQKERAERMPDEQSAIKALFQAWYRLTELGWRDPIYCPKDETSFQVIEAGSTGIHPCHYSGDWPTGSWLIEEDGGCPSRPVLFKLYPADQARYDAKMAEARERFRAAANECPRDPCACQDGGIIDGYATCDFVGDTEGA